jgi:hypothetical protein
MQFHELPWTGYSCQLDQMTGPSLAGPKSPDVKLLGHISTDGKVGGDKKRPRLGSEDLTPASSDYITQEHERKVLLLYRQAVTVKCYSCTDKR